ncbi:MAG: type II toxin-antitoxin system PemK/MazF family toxin [Deltaproteobacteria bacterium]|nr:type II toxin-antitoxin system PemK/MazF family toxin [Deltaproteobacteria bacterium]MBW1795507.1 type II toxin-antitoxin system PemK/MazF family toxin [Deltaproteobacteria bacterium]
MTGTLADQLKSAGYTSNQINKFDVFSIADDVITFPEERLGKSRKKHEKRLVIVLQNDKDNNDPNIKICSIAPFSTGKQFYRLDYLLKKTDHKFLRDDSYIRIGHIQPILKTDLTTKWGSIVIQSIRGDIQDRIFLLHDLEV